MAASGSDDRAAGGGGGGSKTEGREVAFFGGGFGYCVATRGLGRDDADEAARSSGWRRASWRARQRASRRSVESARATRARAKRVRRGRDARLDPENAFRVFEEPQRNSSPARAKRRTLRSFLVPARVVTHSSTPSSFAMDAADVASDSESYDDASASGASRRRRVGRLERPLRLRGQVSGAHSSEHARAEDRALANDIDAYSFDLNPEYRLKVVKSSTASPSARSSTSGPGSA